MPNKKNMKTSFYWCCSQVVEIVLSFVNTVIIKTKKTKKTLQEL